MNYRHAYHAGNFADVLKHVVLSLVIEHLKLKPSPFRVIDTHAGVGLYDLGSVEAGKTGEWREGIGRLLAARAKGAVAEALAPYITVVRSIDDEPRSQARGPATAEEGGDTLRHYPGSPLIARRLLRRGDVLVANELHVRDRVLLAERFAGDPQTRVLGLDGWMAIKSLLPPRERRGVILVDPPFEQPGEFGRLARALADIVRRFATGTALLWYPIKDPRTIAEFHRDISSLGIDPGRLLVVELMLRAPTDPERLNGSGLVILNPPFTLAAKLELLLPYLAKTLSPDGGGKIVIRTLT